MTTDALLSHQPDELLTAFIQRFNDLQDEFFALNTENALLREQAQTATVLSQQLEGYKRQCAAHIETETKLHDQITALTAENAECRELAVMAEKTAQKTIGVSAELTKSKNMIKALQDELKALRALNPQKMKNQIARLKEKDAEQKKRIATQEQVIKVSKQATTLMQKQLNESYDKISSLGKELAHEQGSGLFHKGDHHLIVWPQKTRMQKPDGSIFEGRSLLYLHQSGRGGLITYDPAEGAKLCAAPRGGIRPSADCVEFAQNWLFNVNELQNGVVTDADMIAINYNGSEVAA